MLILQQCKVYALNLAILSGKPQFLHFFAQNSPESVI